MLFGISVLFGNSMDRRIWFKQYFICIIGSMLNSIYTIKYMSGFENKHIAYINHLLQIMSSYEWYMQNKVCPVRKYYTYINIIVTYEQIINNEQNQHNTISFSKNKVYLIGIYEHNKQTYRHI